MSKNRKEVPFIPSAFAFAVPYSEILINNELDQNNFDNLAEKLISIVQSTDQNIGVYIILYLFNRIQQQNENSKDKLISLTKSFISILRTKKSFRTTVLKTFNRMTQFPEQVFALLDYLTNLHILVIACSSKYEKEAREYLQKNILPNITQKDEPNIDENVLFDICDLNFENFNPKAVFQPLSSPAFSVYIPPKLISNMQQQDSESITNIKTIPIYSVLAEANSNLIATKSRLLELFSFYPDFGPEQAAAFVLSLVLPQYHFMEYIEKNTTSQKTKLFEMHRSILADKGITVNDIIEQFKYFDIVPLPRDSCCILFSILQCYAGNNKIDPLPFLQKWRSIRFQDSILIHFTMNNVPIIDFSTTPNQANIDNFLPSPKVFSECCNCWKSMEFIQCIIALHGNDVAILEKFLEPLIVKYPAVILTIFAKPEIELTPNIIKISSIALEKLLKDPTVKETVNNLWKNSSHFISQLLFDLYKSSPSIIDKIYETFGEHVNELVEFDDFMFATEIALLAASNNKMSIGTFIDNYMNKYGQDKVLHITHFISHKVSHMNSAQLKVTCNFFLHLSNNFSKFSVNQQFFIQSAAIAAQEEQPTLDIPVFDLKIPQKTLQEAKERAHNMFNQLFQGKETIEHFLQKLSGLKFSDPILHEEIFSIVLSEIPNIPSMKINQVKVLGDISGHFVASHNLNKKQTNDILKLIKDSLNNDENTPSYQFGLVCLEVILPQMSHYPQFIYDLIRETKIRDNSPEIFDSLQKIGQNFTKPLPTTINVHPKLLRFKNLKPPSPKLAKDLLHLIKEPQSLIETLSRNVPQTWDRIALTVVDAVQDNPALLQFVLPAILKTSAFIDLAFQAAAFRSLQHILAPEFKVYEGCIRRRRLLVLGRFIGSITLQYNRPILSRFLDLKKLLLYGISQGCLYGIVPFVTTILSAASPFFKPPNPFMSGLMYILAGINAMDSIKMSIKQQILGLFNNKQIGPAMFDNVPRYFPSRTKDNYDFLITPFSLVHILSQPDIEKITQFDETILANFVQQNVIIPETIKMSPRTKELIKERIAKVAFKDIHVEGNNLAKTASSTTLELVKKDFKNSGQPEIMFEPAYEMTKQLAASLTLFTAPMKLSRNLVQSLLNISSELDTDDINEIAAKNYEWISQLLRDIVSIRAWKTVQEQLKRTVEDEKMKKSRNIPLSTNSCSNAQKIYAEYLELSLSQQQFPLTEFTQLKEKNIPTDADFDSYIGSFRKHVNFDQPNDSNIDSEQVKKLLNKCTNYAISPIDYKHFLSIIKSILKTSSKGPSRQFEIVLCQILERIVTSVPTNLIEEIRPYVLSWVHTLLPSYFVCDLVRLKLVLQKDLDKEFTALINSEPFNIKVLLHIMQTLYVGMCETNRLNPREMISTLTAVCTIPLENTKEIVTQRQQQYLKPLTQLFDTVYAPEESIPTNTKLQTFCTYDAMEALSQGKAANAVSRWRTAYHERDASELVDETREVLNHGQTALAALFFSETAEACATFMNVCRSLLSPRFSVSDVLEAVLHILKGCSMVIKFDTSKYFDIVRTTFQLLQEQQQSPNESVDRYEEAAKVLHKLRPSEVPSFTFAWIQLISDKLFVVPLLSNERHYVAYFVLLADFMSVIGSIYSNAETEDAKEAFEITYRALLRLILILLHDYRDFMAQCAPLLVQFLPFNFTQIRNLLLSLENKQSSIFLRASLQLQVSEKFVALMQQAFTLQQQQQTPIQEKDFSDTLKLILDMLKDKTHSRSSTYYFVQTILKNIKLNEGNEQYAIKVFIAVMELCDSRLSNSISNIIVDYIRDCVLVSEATKLSMFLIHSFAQTKQGYTVSEMMMRVLIERLNSSANAPKQLVDFYNEIIDEEEKSKFLSKMPYITKSPEIITFLLQKRNELNKH